MCNALSFLEFLLTYNQLGYSYHLLGNVNKTDHDFSYVALGIQHWKTIDTSR